MAHVGDDWTQHFQWRGVGPIPRRDAAALETAVLAAHERNCRLRFWGLPDSPGPARQRVWRALLAAGIDFIGSDDLDGLESELRRLGDRSTDTPGSGYDHT